MRKLFTLTLVSYLLALSMPFVALATHGGSDQLEGESDCDYDGSNCDEESTESTTTTELPSAISEIDSICTFGEVFVISTEDDLEEQMKQYETISSEMNTAMENSYATSTCGEPNTYTGLYEKGDCSADGYVVTEITEVIAPDVDLGDDRVITLYSGLCCMAYTTDSNNKFSSCQDVRTIYTGTYDECTGFAANCEKRQWVIGSSGIGIVKLMVKQIFTFGVLAVGSIAVSTIVFQGIKISVSGVSGDITESKNKILQAIGGIVLLFLSGLILYAINPTFFG